MRESYQLDPALETQDEEDRQDYLESKLRSTVALLYREAPRVKRLLDSAGIPPAQFGLKDLRRVPITRKDALSSMQTEEPPLAGFLAGPVGRLQRLFASPGPTYVPQGPASDYWRFGMAFAATGFRPGDVVLNTLSYHLTPGGFMLDSGLRSLGCVVIPAGTGQTDLQVRTASALQATGYAGTPSFLRTLVLRARELNVPLRFEAAFATAEMLPESLRQELEGFGIRVLQGYATADLGVLAYECSQKNGMHLQPECIVEVLDLETGQPAQPGQPGQVVGTTFDDSYPLLRFATGDIAALAPPGGCPCGRTAPRLKGLLGRVGDAVKVKGMFVRGSQMDEVMKQFPAVARFQAVVTREEQQDHLLYLVELAPGASTDTALLERIAESLRDVVKVRGEVQVAQPGTIGDGAKKIDDRRVWK
ncbi:MAG: phenylacetate--CoA ligase [Deltaproteobacteria bacterium]|nr:MAG: phenylacetate--CoA ligase [Deltaproteobacteria bacterium]